MISTDYSTYAVVYSCDEKAKFAYLYYLSRTAVMTKEQLAKCEAIAKASLPNFDFGDVYYDEQGSQCSYVPEPAYDLNMWL